MFFRHYGLEIVTGKYWAGKTFQTNLWLRVNSRVLNITNFVSQASDFQYRSMSDLVYLLDRVYQWKLDPINRKYPVHIVVDEGFLYFDSRDFKVFPKEIKPFLVQVRKMNVRISVIVQNPNQVDVHFRRLSGYVREYSNFRLFFFSRVYQLLGESGNIHDEFNAEPVGWSIHLPASLSILWVKITSLSRLWLTRLPTIGKYFDLPNLGLYDTNEMIIPYYDILDRKLLNEKLPISRRIDSSASYKSLVSDSSLSIIDGILPDFRKVFSPDLPKKDL